MISFFAFHQLLTIMLVLAGGGILGQLRIGPIRFGAAGALFVGLLVGALDPRLGHGMDLVKSLGVVLFCYTVGLGAGCTFLSDLRRQWGVMLVGVLGLVVMALVNIGLAPLLGLSPSHVSGAYAGVLTSPAISAAIAVTRGSGDTLAGYALAYPVGVVLGLVVDALVLPHRWPARRDGPSLAEAGLTTVTTRVERATGLRDVPGWSTEKVKISCLQRGGTVRVTSGAEELQEGDRVVVVGAARHITRAVDALGHTSSHDLTHHRGDVDFKRFVVSNPEIVGRPIGELDVRGRLQGIVTCVRRNDLDLLARDDLVLQPGDQVLAVVPRTRMDEASTFFGDSDRRVSQVDAVTLGIGIATGMLAGCVTVPLPGGLTFSLGAAAGPLVVGMVLGAVHRTGPFCWDPPHAVTATLRQLGLMVFLAVVGLTSGPAVAAQALNATGLAVVVLSTMSLALGAAIILGGARLLDLSSPRATGAFAGFVGQPAILAYANSRVNDERIDSAYGALFALGTIVKILAVQVIALS